jgi:hypothetical protein
MILVGTPVDIHCDNEGCGRSIPAQLALMPSGGFGFRPSPEAVEVKDWQVGVTQAGAFLTFCPTHTQEVQRVQLADPKLQVGPRGPRMVKPNGR